MKKHTYRTKNVNKIDWLQLKDKLQAEPLVLAVDIAKQNQFALLTNISQSESQLLKWEHPLQTPFLLEQLQALEVPITVVMESTGTYGDALRFQFRQMGCKIYQASAKRVHDAQEVYDGVPSLHDAKSAFLIAKLHFGGVTKPWSELNSIERELNALHHEYELHQEHYYRNLNRLEAYLSRHWPEVQRQLDLNSVTLETLLIEYGSPAVVAENAGEVFLKMQTWSRHKLTNEKINAVIDSAAKTLGQPCIEAECEYLKALASELFHSRQQRNQAKKALEEHINEDDSLSELVSVIGAVSTAVLLGLHLDPRAYDNPKSFRKALGLNLKEKSSGQYQGQLKLTKRGSSTARKYLYYAALRLISNNAVIKKWYLNKVDTRAKSKTVIALMRKLALAIWYLVRGEKFDVTKLIMVNA